MHTERNEREDLRERGGALGARYRRATQRSDAAVLLLDGRGTVRAANASAEACFGMRLAGQALVPLLDEPAQVAMTRAVARAHEAREETEFTSERVAGHACTLRWTLSAADDGQVLAVAREAVCREREERGAELRALAMMGSLAARFAHEIRNPLNAANLQLELLLRRAKRVRDVDDDVFLLDAPAACVRAEIGRLSTLLDDFLQLARPLPPVRRTCALRPLLGDVLAREAPRAAKVGVVLRVLQPEPGLCARVDAHALQDALGYLIQNAVDALVDRDGGEVVLRAEARHGGGVTIAVEDDGPGVSPEVLGTAFEPFVTTKPAGTGLGLAIVRRIVEQHEGEVTLAARPGGGTIARLWVSD